MSEGTRIRSVQKAMDILRIISDSDCEALKLGVIAEKAGLNKSTCAHILATLCDEGFVEKSAAAAGYKLGLMSYYITRRGKYQQGLIQLCHPIMRWLQKQTGQTVILSVLHDTDKYIIHYVKGKRELASSDAIILGNIAKTATGRVLLSSMSSRDRLAWYNQYHELLFKQWSGIHDFSSFEKELNLIADQGYAFVGESPEVQTSYAIGAGIYNELECLGAIGIALELTEGEMPKTVDPYFPLVEKLRKAVKEIRHRLSFEVVG